MKRAVVFLIIFVNLIVFAGDITKLTPKKMLLFQNVKVESLNKGLNFSVSASKKVVYCSIVIGFLPNEKAYLPVYRFSVNEFPENADFNVLIKWSKFKWYLNNEKTLVFYKINLIDENGYQEQYRSRILVSKNRKLLQTVVNGPYIVRDEDNFYKVWFELLYPDTAELVFNNKTFKCDKKKKRHVFEIGKLEKGEYPYFVKGYPRNFIAKINETPDFAFAFMSDSRNTKTDFDSNFQNVNGEIIPKIFLTAYQKGVDFFLFVGDLVSGYTGYVDEFERELKSFLYATEPVSSFVPVYTGMGNHEALIDCFEKDGKKFCRDKKPPYSAEDIFAKVFINPENGDFSEGKGLPPYKENVYYFEYGNCLFVVLNTNYWWSKDPEIYGGNLEGYIMDKQMEWLENVLRTKGKDKREIFVFAHEPAFPVSAHLKDGMYYWGGDPAKNNGIDRRYVLKMRDRFLKILDKHGVNVVFFGDEHNYSRVLINSKIAPIKGQITQIVSGGAGAPFYELAKEFPWKDNLQAFSKENHFVLVNVGKTVRISIVSVHGYVVDSFELK